MTMRRFTTIAIVTAALTTTACFGPPFDPDTIADGGAGGTGPDPAGIPYGCESPEPTLPATSCDGLDDHTHDYIAALCPYDSINTKPPAGCADTGVTYTAPPTGCVDVGESPGHVFTCCPVIRQILVCCQIAHPAT